MPLLQKHLQPWAHNFSENKQINKEPHGWLMEEDAGEADDLFWKLPSKGQDFPVERYLRVTAERSPHLANKRGRHRRIRTWPFSNPDELWIQQWPPVPSSWQEHTEHLWNSPAQKSTWNRLSIWPAHTGNMGVEECVALGLVSKLLLWETQRTKDVVLQQISPPFKQTNNGKTKQIIKYVLNNNRVEK